MDSISTQWDTKEILAKKEENIAKKGIKSCGTLIKIIPIFGIYANTTTIHSCLNSKFERPDRVSSAADLITACS